MVQQCVTLSQCVMGVQVLVIGHVEEHTAANHQRVVTSCTRNRAAEEETSTEFVVVGMWVLGGWGTWKNQLLPVTSVLPRAVGHAGGGGGETMIDNVVLTYNARM